MSDIKIHVFHTGEVCVAPDLPFGGDNCTAVKASGIFGKKEDRLWLPVSAYLIEHPKGLFLVDTGWARAMSPEGVFDKKAQIKSLGSWVLYKVNQGRIGMGECIDEQLAAMGVATSDIDAVLLTHLDCDHANGIAQVADAKRFVVAADEVRFASKASSRVRYNKDWWGMVELDAVEWNGALGPFGKSFDLLGDGSIQLINIPGHADGLFAVKVTNGEGKFVLLFSDGGYARKSWEEQITSGIAADKAKQKRSLAWIREQSLDPLCVESLANHDPDIEPHVIEL
ncbi:N-acyl homoserine lactonase AttM [Slackia heliotrinireducens]|uniref:Metallo-beta-lactamase superfamily enzyme n=1 Tax=Slackia heliotrinireducens (strain ATCC 29202 / DSM 20476 / NCTC 11029 / RHS 1) TaxID=471855 RepID=C7N7J0_SLAHD|nr:N-acyl homoserine lactonase family protein [Slackia heliotrinireducens]ACV22875.1 metallo-beta-lactamase superfamily enzyme [Slackia heliotrinireducens DSM 20476]VEH01644.1 N-acyl homoserine lactonase AttM [Slackia heliotrinireducens]